MTQKLYQSPGSTKYLFLETTKLEKPYGGTEIPNLGSCKMYIQDSHNSKPKQITFEVLDVLRPVITRNTNARELNLLKLN